MPLATTPASDWPADHDAVRFIVRTAPDHRGKQTFFALFWRDGARKLLAHLNTKLAAHVERARAEGLAVEIVERFGDLREAA